MLTVWFSSAAFSSYAVSTGKAVVVGDCILIVELVKIKPQALSSHDLELVYYFYEVLVLL